MTADTDVFEVEMERKEEGVPDFYDVSLGSAPGGVAVSIEESAHASPDVKVMEGTYVIESRLCSETVLKAAAGWNVTVGTGTGEARQAWDVARFGRGYRLMNKASGLVLHLKTCRGGGTAVQREWDGSDAQLWRFREFGPGHRLVHRNGLALCVKKESGANRAVCMATLSRDHSPEQNWILRPVADGGKHGNPNEPVVLDDTYTIVASGGTVSSAKLSATGSSPALAVLSQAAANGQHWLVRRVADSHYQIVESGTSRVLGASPTSSEEVTLAVCSPGDAQLWEAQRRTAWTVTFTNKFSGRVLGVGADGVAVALFPADFAQRHRWYLNPIPRNLAYWRTKEGILALIIGVVGLAVLIGFLSSLPAR
ncbi:hypothetical protein DIPPA_01297 [Diplonema papillatum]|nr:hypothetical protein DIPPA_01297 [Diplonema papillatum]|eukprot:gene7741-11895_t